MRVVEELAGHGSVSLGDEFILADVRYRIVVSANGHGAPRDTRGTLMLTQLEGRALMMQQSALPFTLTLEDGSYMRIVLSSSRGTFVRAGCDL